MPRRKQLATLVAVLAIFSLLFGCSGNSNMPVSVDDASLGFSQEESSAGSLGFGRHGGFGAGHGLMAVLKLSDEQQQQVQEIVQKSMENRPDHRHHSRGDGSWEEMREARKAHREQIFGQILEVLTPEQQEKARALKAKFDNGEVPQELVEYHIAQLTEKLNLTADQQEQVRGLGTAARMQALRNASGDRRELRQKKREIVDETHAKMMEILTPEQQDAFEEMIASHHKRDSKHGRRFGPHHLERRLEHLTAELELSDAQADEIRGFFEAFQAELEQTSGDHGRGHRRREFREQMQEKRDGLHDKIKNILTDEQAARFEELLKRHRR